MSGAYIVISVDNCFDIDVEAHAGFEGARQRALEIATGRYPDRLEWIIENPIEEKLSVGSSWIFVNTSKACVCVIYQPIQSPQYKATLITSQLFADDCGYVQTVQEPLVIKDNPADPALPGGWDYRGKPITIQSVVENPNCVAQYDTLSSKQQAALVKARISKRPNYSILIPGHGTFIQSSALAQLNPMNYTGNLIVAEEMAWLDNFLQEQLPV